MRNTCDILTYFGTALRCVYVLLMHTFANLCVFLCRRRNKTLFCANHAKEGLILERTYRKHKQNANENANTFCNFCVCTCVHGLCFVYVGRKIRPYFGQIRPYFIAYVKETQTET